MLCRFLKSNNVIAKFFEGKGLIYAFGEGNGKPFHYSCLENSMDRGGWWAAVHGVAWSRTRLKWLCTHACIHLCFKVSAVYLPEEVTKFITKSIYHIMSYAYFHYFWENQSREISYIQIYQITEARNSVELIFFKHGKWKCWCLCYGKNCVYP